MQWHAVETLNVGREMQGYRYLSGVTGRGTLLILGVCAPLVVFFDTFLVITSASFLSGFVT